MRLVRLAVALAGGMLLADAVDLPLWALGLAGVWALAIALVEWNHADRRRAALLALVFLLGCWRWPASQPTFGPEDLGYWNGSGRVEIEGTIHADPVIRGTRQQLQLRAEFVTINGQRRATRGLVQITTGLHPSYRYGQRLTAAGQLESPPVLEGFDYREYLASQGVGSIMRRATLTVHEGSGGSSLLSAISRIRGLLRERIEQILPHPEAGLLQGILLGLDHTLPEDLAEAFRIAGLTHIIVISGYNVSILLGAWFTASSHLLHRWTSLVTGLLVLAGFVLLVGPTPPVVRAGIMGAMAVLAQLAGRRDWPLASLALSVLIMLLYNPLLLHSVSFQLSLAATLSLIVLLPRLETLLAQMWGTEEGSRPGWHRILSEVLLATTAAQLFTLPVIWAHFGTASLLALVANALVLPMQPLILVPGAAIVLLSLVTPALARVAALLLWLPLRWTILVARWIASIGWASVQLPPFSPAAAWGLVILLFLLVGRLPKPRANTPQAAGMDLKPLWPAAIGAALVSVLWLVAGNLPDGRLHVSFLDVGQGDAILLRSGSGRTILIDGGPDPVRLASQLGQALPFWQRDIDLVLVTHEDTDHIGALAALASRYRIHQVVYAGLVDSNEASAAWQSALADADVQQVSLGAGTEIRLGQCLLRLLHPPLPLRDNEADSNARSMVLAVEQGTFRMLLMGDAPEPVEKALLASGQPLDAILLKVSHHGSSGASSQAFLEAVSPQLAVISVGDDNRYGHPNEAVLDRLRSVDATVLRTDQHGGIRVSTDGRTMWVQTERQERQ
ncbi:MAG: DNA internalization-related competence protein ComEC/Rec2 [Anaerolineae bacterium]|jgi:competence protein ComEC|nr:DNA internalization-related competence protein ComEC/Rec2 [Chloroflexota bacterium]